MTTSATPFDGRFGTKTGPAVRLTVGPAVADVLPTLRESSNGGAADG